MAIVSQHDRMGGYNWHAPLNLYTTKESKFIRIKPFCPHRWGNTHLRVSTNSIPHPWLPVLSTSPPLSAVVLVQPSLSPQCPIQSYQHPLEPSLSREVPHLPLHSKSQMPEFSFVVMPAKSRLN